jgi:dCMP deaminase
MLIGIVGPQLSGKKTVLRYLTKQLQFTELTISPSGSKNEFSNLSEAVNFATTNWRERYVIQNIDRYKHQDLLFKRPFFLLLYIESSSFIRYSRSVKNISLESLTISDGIAIERFLLKDDCQLYNPFGNVADKDELYNTTTTLYDCSKLSNYQVLNNSTIAALYEQLLNLDLLNPERTRPCWDTYFMALCELASQRSNCMKRRVGCIIVSECRVISTGYNGF